MKKSVLTMLSLTMVLSLSTCGSRSNDSTTTGDTSDAIAAEVLVGQAKGFGGLVTVTVTKEGDTVVSVAVDAPDETDGIGTMAVVQLPAQIVEANGVDGVDAVSGATVTSEAIMAAFNNAINGVSIEEETSEETEVVSEFTVPVFSDEPVGEVGAGLRIGQMEYAAHGDKSFAVTTVVLNGDTVVAVYIDEYQFMNASTTVAVPNSDQGFLEKYADPERVLGSKRLNSDTYSANMAERGGSTMALTANFGAIEEYVTGKTIAELEDLVYNNTAEEVVDAVSSATLADTSGYVKSVIEAARVAAANDGLEYSGDVASLKFGRTELAAHGKNCFLIASALVDGDTIVLSYLDEYQLMSGAVVGVPNSDGGFGENFIAGTALISKRYNTTTYSALMAERGGATIALDVNYDSIQNYANGKTISEVLEVAQGDAEAAIDAISSATLVDTNNYLGGIVAAAEVAD